LAQRADALWRARRGGLESVASKSMGLSDLRIRGGELTTIALLGPRYLYMPDLPMWLHWGIYVALLGSLSVACLLYILKLRRLGISVYQLLAGLRSAVSQNPRDVLAVFFGDALGQRRERRARLGAVLHSLIFYSFGMLLLGTTLIGVQHDLTSRLFGFEYLQGDFYLGEKALLDGAALGLLAGVAIAMWRRYRVRPAHLGARRSVGVVYGSLIFMSLSGLVLEATRELLLPTTWAWWTYAGHVVALAIHPIIGVHALLAYEIMWAIHVSAAFTLVGAGAATTLDHVVTVPTNLVLATNRRSGLVAPPFDLSAILEAEGDLENLSAGFANPSELTWDRRLMLDACLNCGRCEATCPATISGRALSPRLLIQALRTDLRRGEQTGEATADVFGRGVVSEDAIWSCLTCSACRRECPAGIDQPGVILDLRRHLAEQGRLDEQKALVLSGLERNQNPLGLPSYQRADWLIELGVPSIRERPDVEYLYWIGCMASYDQRAREIVRSMIKILEHVGVTFAILGNEEQCHGECQRRLGDEAGFQLRTMELSAQLRDFGVKKILTHCPHCMNTFKNDYKEFGHDFEVVHHSQLLAQLIDDGRLSIDPALGGGGVAYHDPCNLGRILGVFDAPRAVVKASVGEVVEFERNAEKSFCCGAGGANYFYKVEATQSVAGLRLAQAREVGAEMVATACPFCLGMLEDASRSDDAEHAMKVMDLAELVAARLPSSGG
jgi:Fe-S oxidoreductase